MDIINYEVCDSTNLRAREYVIQNSPDRAVFIAKEQTDGRGRQGKSFFSPKDTGVYLSFAFKVSAQMTDVVCVTTYAAAKVCKALEKVSGTRLDIKWVNDIYFQGKKICGILAQNVISPKTQKVEYVIIGVGVNLTTMDFPDDIREIAGNLGDVGYESVKNELINSLQELADNFSDRSFMDYYRSRSMVLGKEIIVITKDGQKNAVACEIDNDGGLCVRFEDGSSQVLTSGEISLKFTKNVQSFVQNV